MTTLPVTFIAAPLPVGFDGTPQQFLDAIVARLGIQSPESASIFTTGTVLPTSNIGPFLLNGQTWYVWDVTSGAYIPEVLEFRSLRYVASAAAPNQAIYTLWIELNGSGKAIALKYYSGGAWKDVYEDQFAAHPTTTAMNTAIANAINTQSVVDSNARRQFPFRAFKSAAAQIYTNGSGDAQVVFDSETFDPNSVFGANVFTAPVTGYYYFKSTVSITLDSGTPTVNSRQLKLRVNGADVMTDQYQINDDTDGVTLTVSDQIFLTVGNTVDVTFQATSTGAGTWSITNDSTRTAFFGHKLLLN